MAWNPFAKKDQHSDAYLGLREQWLSGKILSTNLPPGAEPSTVCAVLMEIGRPDGASITFVAGWDGTASMYTSKGGGTIGMGFYASTAVGAMTLVGNAQAWTWALPKVQTPPKPPKGDKVAFHILTPGGLHSAEVARSDLQGERQPFRPLLDAVAQLENTRHSFITVVRLMEERMQRNGGKPSAETLHVHLFADGGIAVLTEGNPNPYWLTPDELQRVLAFCAKNKDRVQVSEAKGVASDHPGKGVLNGAGLSYGTAKAPDYLTFQGGATTLHYAVAIGRQDIVADLAQRRVNINAKDEKGYTPLIEAAMDGRRNAIKPLLNAGADPSAQDNEGNTVLMFAAQTGDPEMVKLLLAAGADIKARGQHGFTALSLAKQRPSNPAIPVLQAAGVPA